MKFSSGISNWVRPIELMSSVRKSPSSLIGMAWGLCNSIQSPFLLLAIHSLMTRREVVASNAGGLFSLPGEIELSSVQSPFLSRPMGRSGTWKP